MTIGWLTQPVSASVTTLKTKKSTRPGWYAVNKLSAKNGQENLYRLTLYDVAVVNLNSKIQSIVLANIQTGVEFKTRNVWNRFCYRVALGHVSNVTLKMVKNSMSTWPSDVQRIWGFIMTVKDEYKKSQNKVAEFQKM